MATDGDIDFKVYTREQLDSAVTRIDRHRYPINAQNLITEYQRRRVAEGQAVELAAKAGTVAAPDRMLSAARPFALTFEPTASFTNWLGPSRNDFHLVGSGTILVDDALVRVRGRRFAYWIGLPVIDTDELGRPFIVNVESQGRAVRFELRVPGEKARGLTVWLRDTSEAEALAGLLPVERTSDFTPQLGRHVEFEQLLIAQSSKTPVTYALVITCVCVYLATAIGTNHLFGFDGPSLVGLGSDFGPYTTQGDWWRLLTSMFLHVGAIHLAFNMWALASFGPVVERLYGSVSYALLYLVAGIAGSLASVSWNPAINSVGASGPVFGVLGALIAAQMRNDGSIPNSVLRPLRNSSLIFTGGALVAGLLSREVDNAAHLGGVAMGFILGLVLSRPITGYPLAVSAWLRRFAVAGPLAAVLLSIGFWSAYMASTRLTDDAGYLHELHWFAARQSKTVNRWHELARIAIKEKWDGDTYAGWLERDILPFWREAAARLGKPKLPPTSVSYENLQFLLSVAVRRARDYDVVVQELRKGDDSSTLDSALEDLGKIDVEINDRASGSKRQP
jgi:rhomboid protease GluP